MLCAFFLFLNPVALITVLDCSSIVGKNNCDFESVLEYPKYFLQYETVQ